MNDIFITGGCGLIGSALVKLLNDKGIRPTIYDDMGPSWRNLAGLDFTRCPKDLIYETSGYKNDVIVHLGASVDTSEGMSNNLWENNVDKTLALAYKSAKLIYASSASVYGDSEDSTERTEGLIPLNPYSMTKLQIDKQMFPTYHLKRYGLRFFNVYDGKREAHKGNMASPIYKGLNKVGSLYRTDVNPGDREHPEAHWSLFKGDRPISRDFVWVEDVARVIYHFIEKDDIPSGLFNVGSGISTSFEEVVKAIDPALPIHYTPIPDNLRAGYQYFSRANLDRLRNVAGYTEPFKTVPEAIAIMRGRA